MVWKKKKKPLIKREERVDSQDDPVAKLKTYESVFSSLSVKHYSMDYSHEVASLRGEPTR